MSDLKQKAVSGVVWTALQKYTVTFITFVSDIILARLLSPYDFGCVEMLAIFVLLAETIVNGGFNSALIQKKRPTQEDYSTIFFWSLGMSFLLYVIIYFSSPVIARFYNIAELSSILRVQGLILFVYGFNIIQVAILKKQFRFKAISIVTIISSVISLGIAIAMAYSGWGVWSLVAKNLIAAVITSLIFWFYMKWRPLMVFSWESFKELFSFGLYMFLSNLVTTFSSKIQGLLIGKVFNPSTMGYYAKASGTEGVVSTSLSQIMDQITYPLYSEVQDDMKALQSIVHRITVTLAYLTFPLIFITIMIAKPLFVILYTDKWLPAVPYFQVLCFGGLGTCLQSVNFHTISAIGKSKITFKWTMVKRIIGIGFIVGGLVLWGMKGILAGAVLNAWFAYFVNMGLVSKHIGYKWYTQLRNLFPILSVSVVCAAVSYWVVSWLNLSLYLDGAIKLLVFVALYLGWSFVVKPDSYKYFKSIVKPLMEKITKKHRN